MLLLKDLQNENKDSEKSTEDKTGLVQIDVNTLAKGYDSREAAMAGTTTR